MHKNKQKKNTEQFLKFVWEYCAAIAYTVAVGMVFFSHLTTTLMNCFVFASEAPKIMEKLKRGVNWTQILNQHVVWLYRQREE